MEFKYRKHAIDAIIERQIDTDWIERTIEHPAHTHADKEDPELRHFLAPIPENGNRILRVVANVIRTPYEIVTVFFDRRMKGTL
jgi:hypothetical protein